jgi:FkbM family methyltransferase
MNNYLDLFVNLLDKNIQKKNLKIIKQYLGGKKINYIDVGAHNGEMILLLSNHFKMKKIFAFEPNLEIVAKLKKLKIKNLNISKYALSDRNGDDFLKIGHLSSMSTLNRINKNSFYTFIKKVVINFFYKGTTIYKKKIKIKKIRLDKIKSFKKIKKIDLIKIDTEGHEFNVIKGMGNLLKKTNLILFEYHYDNSLIKGYDFNEINKYLVSNNFSFISRNKMLFRKGYEIIYKNKIFN